MTETEILNKINELKKNKVFAARYLIESLCFRKLEEKTAYYL